jgi:hypothetical protein
MKHLRVVVERSREEPAPFFPSTVRSPSPRRYRDVSSA